MGSPAVSDLMGGLGNKTIFVRRGEARGSLTPQDTSLTKMCAEPAYSLGSLTHSQGMGRMSLLQDVKGLLHKNCHSKKDLGKVAR